MEPTVIAAASQKLAELLSLLSKRAKDRETAALVQQIQAQQQIVHTALHEEQSKSLGLERELFRLEQTHAKAIAERDDKIRQLQTPAAMPEAPPETPEERRYNDLMRGMNAGS